MNPAPVDYLKRLGDAGEGPHDIARAALMLSALDHMGQPLEPCLAHLNEIAEAMRAEAGMLQRVADGARLLSDVLAARLGYEGDRVTYNDPRNADLISVIGRRRGLPVSLGILYIHAARAAGMSGAGLDTPGHFAVRVAWRHDDVTIDPFNGGAVVDSTNMPPELRGLDVTLAQTVSDTDVLLRLQNNVKLRALEANNPQRALEIARRMVLIGPKRPELWFDLARLNEAMGVLGAARQAYERCLGFARSGEALHNEAALSLSNLKRRLN